jgi:hypothetical protein
MKPHSRADLSGTTARSGKRHGFGLPLDGGVSKSNPPSQVRWCWTAAWTAAWTSLRHTKSTCCRACRSAAHHLAPRRAGCARRTAPRVCAVGDSQWRSYAQSLFVDFLSKGWMQIAYSTRRFQQRCSMQKRLFSQPGRHQLHTDRHAIAARAESDRHARQAGQVQRNR